MNIGWILLICAFICLILMAFVPRKRMEQSIRYNELNVSTHLDTLDAKLLNTEDVLDLVRSGQTIKAIQAYRASTGASLVDARAAVARMTAKMREEAPAQRDINAQVFESGQENSLFEQELERLLLLGRKIEAIKLYRGQTGLGLREAKEAVELLEAALVLNGPKYFLPGQVPPQTPVETFDRVPVAETPDPEVRSLILAGRKIEAIKLYREQTGLGLREAKEAVDLLENTLLGGGPGSLFPAGGTQETPRGVPAMVAPDEMVRGLVLEGKKIEAIKLYREQSGLGLREAKATIDLLEQTWRSGLEQA